MKIIDDIIKQKLDIYNVPGCSVSVNIKGKEFFCKGYGLRNIENKTPITNDTIFPIGSITKTFTALALGILFDQKKIDFDKPVKKYLPKFELKDEFLTSRITLRDMLSHRTGLPAHDFVWLDRKIQFEELLGTLKHLDINADIRTKWQYNNIMFVLAGYVIEKVSEKKWNNFISDNIIQPLEMTDTCFALDEMKAKDNFALPYKFDGEKYIESQYQIVNYVAPAGALCSNSKDMLNFTNMLLNNGNYKGKQIISKETLKEMMTPQITKAEILPLKYSEHHHGCYGLGVWVDNHRGHKLVFHGGHTTGFWAISAVLPEDNIGFNILINENKGEIFLTDVLFTLIDKLLNLSFVDWTKKKYHTIVSASMAENTDVYFEKSTGLENYLGSYFNKAYGQIQIIKENETFKYLMNGIKTIIQEDNGNCFICMDCEGEDMVANINFDKNQVKAKLEPEVNDIIFIRE